MRLTIFVCKLMKYAGPAGPQMFLWPMPIKFGGHEKFSEASGAEGPVAMEDFVVPPDCIAELLQELQNIGERTGLCFRGVSHAGDGNIHLDILRNGLTDAEWERRLAEYENEAYTAVYAKGGKISGEHGIGTVRKGFMLTYTDPVELELMRDLKKAWDPDLILNPGKIFDIDG